MGAACWSKMKIRAFAKKSALVIAKRIGLRYYVFHSGFSPFTAPSFRLKAKEISVNGRRSSSPMSFESVKRQLGHGSAVSFRLSDNRPSRPFSIDSYYYYYS